MEKFYEFIENFWHVLGEMSPYLILGFLIAGILHVTISRRTVIRYMGGTGVGSVFKASLFGVPLPLCSCGVIPVGLSLRKSGAGQGASVAFLMSTPQTGVDSILVTYSLLGPVFAVLRPVVALVTGVIGGVLANVMDAPVKAKNGEIVDPAECEACRKGVVCNLHGPEEKKQKSEIFSYGFVTLPRDIGGYLLIGLLAAALISTLVPEGYFSTYLGTGLLPMLVMMVVGIPMYVCSTASVPVAAALLAAGVSPGAALVFLMTGPATNAATLTSMWKILEKKSTLIYLFTIATGALVSGLLLDAIATGSGIGTGAFRGWELPVWARSGSALLLAGIMAYALVPGWIRRIKHGKQECDCHTGCSVETGGEHGHEHDHCHDGKCG